MCRIDFIMADFNWNMSSWFISVNKHNLYWYRLI